MAGSAADARTALETAYRERLQRIREATGAGAAVVGYVGADVPAALLEAAGARAYRLHGTPGTPLDEARAVLGDGTDPWAHQVLAALLAHAFGPLRGVVVGRDCQASQRLSYALRELRRLDPERGLPPVHLLDVLHLPNATTLRYNAARLRQLPEEVLPCWLGTGVSDSALATAMARRREVRRLLDGVERFRRTDRPRLTGAQALRIHGATSVLPVQESLDLLSVLTADPAGLPDLAPMTRVFLTGSNHDHDGVYVALEDEDTVIVGEDHDNGIAAALAPDDDRLDDLAVALRDRGPAAPTSTMSRRAEATLEASSAAGATVVVSFIRSCDEAPSWDYPVQRTLLATRGIPAVLLDRQPYDPDPAALRELVGQARSGSGVLP